MYKVSPGHHLFHHPKSVVAGQLLLPDELTIADLEGEELGVEQNLASCCIHLGTETCRDPYTFAPVLVGAEVLPACYLVALDPLPCWWVALKA